MSPRLGDRSQTSLMSPLGRPVAVNPERRIAWSSGERKLNEMAIHRRSPVVVGTPVIRTRPNGAKESLLCSSSISLLLAKDLLARARPSNKRNYFKLFLFILFPPSSPRYYFFPSPSFHFIIARVCALSTSQEVAVGLIVFHECSHCREHTVDHQKADSATHDGHHYCAAGTNFTVMLLLGRN